MINEYQITYNATEKGLQFLVTGTDKIIAIANKDRFLEFSHEISITKECKNLIEYISLNYDDVYYLEDGVNFFRVFNECVELAEGDKVVEFGFLNDTVTVLNIIKYDSGVVEYYLSNFKTVLRVLLVKELTIVLPAPEKEKTYYLQKNGDYLGNSIMWFDKSNRGYTPNIKKAKIFSIEEAKKYDLDAKFTAWECDYIDNNSFAIMTVIDHQYCDYKNAFKNV